LKDICVSVEESSEIGRLFDIDVINNNGRKIERKTERNCLICSAKGRMCAATRKHDYKTLQAKTNEIITNHFLAKDSKRIGQLATESLLKEVYTTPKPGLVDRRNCGSHKDMEIKTFENSAYSLAYYFTECFKTGYISANKKPEVTLSKLRQLGKNAEKTMYDATNGINTHKGAIFSLGILCGSCGKLWSPIAPNFNVNEIVLTASKIYANAMIDDFDRIKDTTAGGRQYIETGIKGIRGEVASAFSSVINSSLPAYSDALENGMSSNHAGAIALLHLISTVEDTNLYHRGGYEGAAFAKSNARKLLQNNNYPPLEQIEKLDDEFIIRNLSPGGCADLLAVTYFLYSLTKEF